MCIYVFMYVYVYIHVYVCVYIYIVYVATCIVYIVYIYIYNMCTNSNTSSMQLIYDNSDSVVPEISGSEISNCFYIYLRRYDNNTRKSELSVINTKRYDFRMYSQCQ